VKRVGCTEGQGYLFGTLNPQRCAGFAGIAAKSISYRGSDA
jgi:hypothetical protein